METAELERKKARLKDIIAEKSFSHGTFKLASGAASGYYFDMKPTMLDPEGADLISDLVMEALEGEEVDAVGGLAYGAIPMVAAVVQKSATLGRPIPGFYVRKEQKERGAEKLIDGILPEGATVVIFEDVTTKGGSAMRAVDAVRAQGCKVARVVTIVDRLDNAAENLKANGIALTALLTKDDFGE